MRTAKTDQTGRLPKLIRVFAGRTCHFVGFVMKRLIWFTCILFHRTFYPFFKFAKKMHEPITGDNFISNHNDFCDRNLKKVLCFMILYKCAWKSLSSVRDTQFIGLYQIDNNKNEWISRFRFVYQWRWPYPIDSYPFCWRIHIVKDIIEKLYNIYRGATYFVFEVSCFSFCQIKFVCTDVAMCDPVHDVETVFRLC